MKKYEITDIAHPDKPYMAAVPYGIGAQRI